MVESIGVIEARALARSEEVQNVCRWCNEFFEQYFEGPMPPTEPTPVRAANALAASAA